MLYRWRESMLAYGLAGFGFIPTPSTHMGNKSRQRLSDKKEEPSCPLLVPSKIRPEPSHRGVD
jgi:hypothetical protein